MVATHINFAVARYKELRVGVVQLVAARHAGEVGRELGRHRP